MTDYRRTTEKVAESVNVRGKAKSMLSVSSDYVSICFFFPPDEVSFMSRAMFGMTAESELF
jgi:hypothetical protein